MFCRVINKMVQCLNCDTVIEVQDLEEALQQENVESLKDLYTVLKLDKICCRMLLFNTELYDVIVQSIDVEDLF